MHGIQVDVTRPRFTSFIKLKAGFYLKVLNRCKNRRKKTKRTHRYILNKPVVDFAHLAVDDHSLKNYMYLILKLNLR